MIVYHGSTSIIDLPILGKGKTTNDYGRGFYCTENPELAKEWACAKGSDGFANIYQLDLSGLRVLDLNSEEYGILTWLAILARYRSYWENGSISKEAKDYLKRNFFVSPEKYDIVRGYRADDSYFTFAKNFVSNGISLEQLKKAMYLGALGEQIVLKSEKAFKQIAYTGNLPAQSKRYTKQAKERDKEARKIYQELSKDATYSTGIFMIDIIREGMTASDPRLQ
ncbi:DUF3990 domain-containing protein [Pseudoflavonifractor sp. 524-17]|uniref:DUF3990 domain-containing protein n=1 Tax=Pseudoflavonifractor sp. 524-17 TaxID=2304577 RepID=UPI00192A2EDC|nr:DUF3990 domain-containing protein [Pseudoflavonifractor sp. 524-17]